MASGSYPEFTPVLIFMRTAEGQPEPLWLKELDGSFKLGQIVETLLLEAGAVECDVLVNVTLIKRPEPEPEPEPDLSEGDSAADEAEE